MSVEHCPMLIAFCPALHSSLVVAWCALHASVGHKLTPKHTSMPSPGTLEYMAYETVWNLAQWSALTAGIVHSLHLFFYVLHFRSGHVGDRPSWDFVSASLRQKKKKKKGESLVSCRCWLLSAPSPEQMFNAALLMDRLINGNGGDYFKEG